MNAQEVAMKADDTYHYYTELWVTPISIVMYLIGIAAAIWAALSM
mgnify:CR=1 FL=1